MNEETKWGTWYIYSSFYLFIYKRSVGTSNVKVFMRDMKFSYHCCWWFKSSGMSHYTDWWVVAGISSAIIIIIEGGCEDEGIMIYWNTAVYQSTWCNIPEDIEYSLYLHLSKFKGVLCGWHCSCKVSQHFTTLDIPVLWGNNMLCKLLYIIRH